MTDLQVKKIAEKVTIFEHFCQQPIVSECTSIPQTRKSDNASRSVIKHFITRRE